jgi:hypothetical protein
MIPQSGIDVIKLTLSPIFFNANRFNLNRYVDPRRRLTVHRAGMFYTLEIHIEYMDLTQDFHTIIAKAINDLIQKEYFLFPFFDGVIDFIRNNLNWFVLGISEMEFYFDLMKKSVIVNEDAVEEGRLIQYNEKKRGK